MVHLGVKFDLNGARNWLNTVSVAQNASSWDINGLHCCFCWVGLFWLSGLAGRFSPVGRRKPKIFINAHIRRKLTGGRILVSKEWRNIGQHNIYQEKDTAGLDNKMAVQDWKDVEQLAESCRDNKMVSNPNGRKQGLMSGPTPQLGSKSQPAH